MNQSDPIEWIALSANLGSRSLWERREWSKERRRRMEESRDSARWRRDCSSEEVLEMKDAAESCSSFACSTTLPTSSSIFFADSSDGASEFSPISSIRIALWFDSIRFDSTVCYFTQRDTCLALTQFLSRVVLSFSFRNLNLEESLPISTAAYYD